MNIAMLNGFVYQMKPVTFSMYNVDTNDVDNIYLL